MDQEEEMMFINLTERVEQLESEVGDIEDVKRELEFLQQRISIESVENAIRWIGQRLDKIESRLDIKPPPYPEDE